MTLDSGRLVGGGDESYAILPGRNSGGGMGILLREGKKKGGGGEKIRLNEGERGSNFRQRAKERGNISNVQRPHDCTLRMSPIHTPV